MIIEPLSDYLLIRPLPKPEKKTQTGLILPGVGDKDANLGEIISVGPGKKDETGKVMEIAPKIKPGVKIIFTPQYGHDFNVDGERMFIIPEQSVYAVVSES